MLNRIGLIMAVLGSIAILGAGFLVRLRDGSWILFASALAIGGSALWVSRGNYRGAVLPTALCVVASVPVLAGAALSGAPNAGYPLSPHAIAGAGLASALAGSLLLARRPAGAPDPLTDPPAPAEFHSIFPTGDSCPRCRHPVKATARTCSYCGFALKRYRRR
ncbi:zinc ribbon domain-containing protein [Mycolicibacterium llatzerense]|uniref:zinc ribbon domain-containing protein n=1 Tax=Mycolicibacterium llatzerense TaxID=280871 RepID=UPI0021B4E983|nr:zinc ribbon domain-containing protein [Mycolicibacterium llatzerense]MCT7372652.1 hypothetical protein [Mycolicibacterium llatzerense]